MKHLNLTPTDDFLLRKELASRSLIEYARMAWPILEPGREMILGWPIEAIAEHLEAVTSGEIKRLLINVPPGSMKSLLTRVFWPTWEWGPKGLPSHRFIGASYAQHLAERDNRRARNVILSPWYQQYFGIHLSQDQQARVNFANDSTGWMLATSVGGLGTGERGDRFIIDDPHNVVDAESDAKRAQVLLWFAETVPSRLNSLDDDAIIVIMQRVHQDDVSSVAVDLGYEHLMIPMHYDPERRCSTSIGWSDPRSVKGELMWPERFSEDAVDQLAKTLGPYAAASQLEQTPIPREGGLISTDHIHRIDHLPDNIELVYCRGWDLAASEGRGAYTVGALVGFCEERGDWFITNVFRDRLGPFEVREKMLELAESDGEDIRIVFPQDPGQAGKSQARDISGRLSGLKVKIEIPTGDKASRAEPFAAQVEAGNVYVLNRAWTDDLIEELKFFPNSKYKDQVDAVASAFNHLAQQVRTSVPTLSLAGAAQVNMARIG